MKILHAIFSPDFFGSERYCIELAFAQAAAGDDIAVLIQGGDSDCLRAFRREIAASPRPAALILMPGWLPPWLHRLFAFWTLARFAPHIVHSHLNPAARRVGRIAQARGIPHVLTLHLGYDANEHAGYTGLIALTQSQRETVPPDFQGAVTMVWNWLPAAVERALAQSGPAEVAALRSAWNADDRAFVIGSVGRLAPQKGMNCLIHAFLAAFPGGDEPVRLVIVGEGEERPDLERASAGDRRIILTGTQPDIAPRYLAFDSFVSAARFEPFGFAILEAMAAGCPLIVTRCQGPLDFLADPRARWAEADDEAGLAARLREVAAAGRRRIEYDMAPFTLARAVAQTAEFYCKLIAMTR